MYRTVCLLLSLMLLLLLPAMVSDAAGQDDRKLPRLVPSFDGDGGQAAEESAVRRTAFQRALDRVRPSGRTAQPKKESTFDRLNSGAKRLLVKTKRVLTPWSNQEAKNAEAKKARGNSALFGRKTSRSKPKHSLFGSWFAKEQPKPKPTTVSEWLGQPRP
jgi:hypothetical protein